MVIDKNFFLPLMFVIALSFAVWLGMGGDKGLVGEVTTSTDKPALLKLVDIHKTDYESLKFDKLRELINAHSLHKIESESAPAADITEIMASLYSYAAGFDESPPLLDAFERAAAYNHLLQAKGYKSRLVTLLEPSAAFRTHKIVEIYNPRTRRWEMQDPDYNVFYTFRGSTQRVSVQDVLSQPLENFQPCTMEGYCHWSSLSPEGRNTEDIKPFFAAAIVHGKNKEMLYVSEKRFDIHAKKQTAGGRLVSFCDLNPDLCAGEIKLLN